MVQRKFSSTPLLNNSVAEAVMSEIATYSGRYYYYLGAVINPTDPEVSMFTTDNLHFERWTRRNLLLANEIRPSDVSYSVPRFNWESGKIYDMFDDAYSDKVIGVNLLAGGNGYSNANTSITITGGGGERAKANAKIESGTIVGIDLVEGGNGYSSKPNIIISGTGNGAVVDCVMNFTLSGSTVLNDAIFYVMTDDRNIYKCLDNNGGIPSVDKPVEVTPEPFFTQDGYMWKFMGTIPTYLSNKFLTDRYMPVKNALTETYYSEGEIKQIIMDDSGYGYDYAKVTITGDGNLRDEKYQISGITITNPGQYYTVASLSISPPVNDYVTFQTNKYYFANKYLVHDNRFYKAINTGYTGLSYPIHRNGIITSGNVDLQYVAERITANLSLYDGEITGINDLYGSVHDITILNAGNGYTVAPEITLANSDAQAYSTITNGHLSKIVITNPGKVQTAPNVIIGREWQANSAVVTGEQIFYSANLFTVTDGGTFDSNPPIFDSGYQMSGTANLIYAGNPAIAYSNITYGYGYNDIPEVFISGDGENAEIVLSTQKTSAKAFPIIDNGKIISISVPDGGEGYTTANIIISGNGQEAKARVVLMEGDLMSNQSTSEIVSIEGAIHVIKVISGGYGYNDAIIKIDGDGKDAKAYPIINNGKIKKIVMTDEGKDYTWAKITITGDGKGATARAILPPIGGHGKNPVKELFSKSLSFYTNMGEEKINGVPINNDFRQFGILKNLSLYEQNKFFNEKLGHFSWVVYSSNINANVFVTDTIVNRKSDNSEYVVVTVENDKIILTDLSGNGLEPMDTLIYQNDELMVESIIPPQLDKWSGSMILIDNRVEFSPSEEEKIAFRTTITY